jgi:hypothetical protein
MNAFVVVVVDVFVEELLQMTLVDHDDMIEKISLDGAHPALCEIICHGDRNEVVFGSIPKRAITSSTRSEKIESLS